MNDLKKTMALLALVPALLLGGCQSSASAVEETSSVTYWMQAMPAVPREEEAIRNLTTPGLYDIADGAVVAKTAQLPVDVTADYRGSYGIPEDADRGYAFRILLNDAFWNDGSALTAQDFYSAIEQQPEQYRWIAGVTELCQGWERESTNIISLKEAEFSCVEDAKNQGYHRFYVNTGEFWGLDTPWVSASSRERLRDEAMLSGALEGFVTGAYLYASYLAEGRDYAYWQADYVGITAEPENRMTMDDVGILVTGEKSLVIVTAQPTTGTVLAGKLMDLLPAGDGAYGPYYVRSVSDAAIVLEENPFWPGERTDYQRIECKVR